MPQLSRLEQMRKIKKDGNFFPPMPPVDAPHLIGYLFDLGPTMAAGMGEGPITYSEIEAWRGASGVDLEPWEANFLRRLSIDYLAESQKAQKPDAIAPWKADVVQKLVAGGMADSLRKLAKL